MKKNIFIYCILILILFCTNAFAFPPTPLAVSYTFIGSSGPVAPYTETDASGNVIGTVSATARAYTGSMSLTGGITVNSAAGSYTYTAGIVFGDSALYELADNNFYFRIGGVDRWVITSDYIGIPTGGQLRSSVVSSINPSLAPNGGDPSTGIGWAGIEGVSVIANGTEVARANPDKFSVTVGAVNALSATASAMKLTPVYGTDVNALTPKAMYVGSDGTIGFDSSTLRSKTNVDDLSIPVSWFDSIRVITHNPRKSRIDIEYEDVPYQEEATVDLGPGVEPLKYMETKYRKRIKKREQVYLDEYVSQTKYSLVAENLNEYNPDMVYHDEKGQPSGIDYNQMIPILVKEVQALRSRVAELEAK